MLNSSVCYCCGCSPDYYSRTEHSIKRSLDQQYSGSLHYKRRVLTPSPGKPQVAICFIRKTGMVPLEKQLDPSGPIASRRRSIWPSVIYMVTKYRFQEPPPLHTHTHLFLLCAYFCHSKNNQVRLTYRTVRNYTDGQKKRFNIILSG